MSNNTASGDPFKTKVNSVMNFVFKVTMLQDYFDDRGMKVDALAQFTRRVSHVKPYYDIRGISAQCFGDDQADIYDDKFHDFYSTLHKFVLRKKPVDFVMARTATIFKFMLITKDIIYFCSKKFDLSTGKVTREFDKAVSNIMTTTNFEDEEILDSFGPDRRRLDRATVKACLKLKLKSLYDQSLMSVYEANMADGPQELSD